MVSLDTALWRLVSPLLDEVLELEPAARPGLIANLRRQSPTLAEALTSLLADCERMQTDPFLDTPFELTGGIEETGAGYRIGNYTLERPIGAGGMGAVWLARRSDGRFVSSRLEARGT